VLNELTPVDFTAEADLTEVSDGENVVPIAVRTANDVVDIAWQSQDRVTVIVENIVTREIPVHVETRGSAARGYVLGEPFVDPSVIPVTGPASRVQQLAEARVTVFLDNPRQEVVTTRRASFYDRQGTITSVNGLDVGAEEVVVTVPVDQLAGFAAKPVIVNWEGEPAQGYRLLDVGVEPDSVLVTGSPAELDALSRVRTEAIDITGLRESQTFPVTLDLPEGIQLDEVQQVVVTIEIEPILTSSVVRQEPEVRALGEGLTYTLDVEEVRVFLFGPLEKLDSLADDDVRVTLDLFGLEEGTHSVEPDADVFVTDVEVRSIQPPQLTVFITNVVTTTDEITASNPAIRQPRFPRNLGSSGPLQLLLAFVAMATFLPFALVLARRDPKT
jgi:YbbR domain-containing protein